MNVVNPRKIGFPNCITHVQAMREWNSIFTPTYNHTRNKSLLWMKTLAKWKTNSIFSLSQKFSTFIVAFLQNNNKNPVNKFRNPIWRLLKYYCPCFIKVYNWSVGRSITFLLMSSTTHPPPPTLNFRTIFIHNVVC